jgi:hypothetical protein
LFAAGLRRKADEGYLHALADVLTAWTRAECRRLNISAVLRPVHAEQTEGPLDHSACAVCPLQV